MPIDLVCYQRDTLEVGMRRRFERSDPYLTALSAAWRDGVRKVFRDPPNFQWSVGDR